MNNDSRLSDPASQLGHAGALLLRYGLALIFVWFGFLKFSAYEADGIAPLAMNSPLLSWAIELLGKQGLSNTLGLIEIAVGVLIATRSWSPKLSTIGSLAAALTFLITLSFLFSTPGVWQEGRGFPFLSGMVGQFLIKDLILLAASVWTAGEAMQAIRHARPIHHTPMAQGSAQAR